ncbi:acyl transferase/acyl hydrolase/lysophospholipase [Cyathus striatus]|nr:acyl transferase/acyl hydrolase/lysophospholipase [Cyathus striatus]
MALKDQRNILVLDGGGFRGLSSLLVIDDITRAASARAKKSLRPYEIFDLICGTGVGGIVAILLGQMHMDCRSAIEEYKKLTSSFCGDDETRLWSQVLAGTPINCSLYEEALSQLCVNVYGTTDARIKLTKEVQKDCYTFVNVTSDAPDYTDITYQVRSYAASKGALTPPPATHEWTIREAIRATSASSIYMSPLLLDNRYGYRDAGFSGYNNPVHLAIREFERLWPGEKISTVISLGTDLSTLLPPNVGRDWAPTNGHTLKFVNEVLDKLSSPGEKTRFRKDAIYLAKQLIDIANDSQAAHHEMQTKFSTQSVYFRLDPPNGLKNIDLFDCFHPDVVGNSIDHWMSLADGQAAIDAISNSIVNESTGAMGREEAVNMEPPKPLIGTVNTGYHPQLDMKRPSTMIEYLQNYDVLFIVDDSNSMNKGNRWHETRDALAVIAEFALTHNADTIALEFLNSPEEFTGIKGYAKVVSIFDEVKIRRMPSLSLPSFNYKFNYLGGTPTGAKLDRILKRQIKKLDTAIGTPEYQLIRPLDIIVLTDGVPSDKPQNVLADAVKHMRTRKHHPNCIGIQFVQIGNERGAAKALEKLIYGDNGSMVDTVPYLETLTPQRLERILLGGLHPNIRAMLY